MHKRPEVDLLPLDTEIERTLQNLRRITSAESRNMAHQGDILHSIPEEEEGVERNQRPNTMEDFWRLIIQEEYFAVR